MQLQRRQAHFAALALLLTLAGCATCERHPIMCTVATAVVVGSIAASLQQHDDQRRLTPSMSTTQPTPCQANPAACT